jgi:NAD(P)-dependent dehydrogenase (short-subunit alcohol dehydrogenase family)
MVIAQGCEAVVIRADITDPAAVAAMFEQITALPPAALNLVNNAGIVAPKASIKDLTPDRVSAVFSLNVAAAIEVARHAVAYMRAHHGGGIVNVSLTAARKGMALEYIDYAASKAAIETFTPRLGKRTGPRRHSGQCRPTQFDRDGHSRQGWCA